MATVADYRVRFPEHVDATDEVVQLYLDDVALIMSSEAKWLDFYDVSQLYYTAHFITIAEFTELGDGSAFAPLKRQDVDGVVIESAVGNVQPDFDELLATAYGKRVIFYRKICFSGMYGV